MVLLIDIGEIMASRFSESVDKSKWCSQCYQYAHMNCTGKRRKNGIKKCECKCKELNNTLEVKI